MRMQMRGIISPLLFRALARSRRRERERACARASASLNTHYTLSACFEVKADVIVRVGVCALYVHGIPALCSEKWGRRRDVGETRSMRVKPDTCFPLAEKSEIDAFYLSFAFWR